MNHVFSRIIFWKRSIGPSGLNALKLFDHANCKYLYIYIFHSFTYILRSEISTSGNVYIVERPLNFALYMFNCIRLSIFFSFCICFIRILPWTTRAHHYNGGIKRIPSSSNTASDHTDSNLLKAIIIIWFIIIFVFFVSF